MREILAIKGLENTSPGFRRKLVEIADRQALNPSFLAAVISFETGNTFSPSIRAGGRSSGAVGLIQFTEMVANHLGTTRQALSRMSAEKQLDFVEDYYAYWIKMKGPLHTIEDHYLAVFAPSVGIGAEPEKPLYSGPSEAYERNKKLDKDGDGIITAFEATGPVRWLVDEAQSRAPLQVDLTAPLESDDAIPIVGLVLLFGITTWSLMGYTRRGRLA